MFCECDGSCIPQSKVCDGENDCCTTKHGIGSNNVTCADPKSAKDFEAPDEVNCQCPNPDDQFKCIQKGKQRPVECIANDTRCDGNDDCKDGSDELNCQCPNPVDQFKCIQKGKQRPVECIADDKRCDGNDNCQDGSDESPLEADCCTSCASCRPGCASCSPDPELTFTCKHENDKLLPLKCGKRCDGIEDCLNGLDEKDCPPPPTFTTEARPGLGSVPTILGLTFFPNSF